MKNDLDNYSSLIIYCDYRDLMPKDSLSVICTNYKDYKRYKIYVNRYPSFNSDYTVKENKIKISVEEVKVGKRNLKETIINDFTFNSFPEFINILLNGTKMNTLLEKIKDLNLEQISLEDSVKIIRILKEEILNISQE